MNYIIVVFGVIVGALLSIAINRISTPGKGAAWIKTLVTFIVCLLASIVIALIIESSRSVENLTSQQIILNKLATSEALSARIMTLQESAASAKGGEKEQLQATVAALEAQQSQILRELGAANGKTASGQTMPTMLPNPPAKSTAPPITQPKHTELPITATLPPTHIATACPDQQNAYGLNDLMLARLGCADNLVPSRYIVTQEFDNGFMIVFDDASNSNFTKLNQQRKFYALANNGMAWRVFFDNENVKQTTSPNQDDWYTCRPASGQRPSESRIPWRGFGMVWCNHPEIQNALGLVKQDADEIKGTTSFQSFNNGRAFAFGSRIYVVMFDPQSDIGQKPYLAGAWAYSTESLSNVAPANAQVPNPSSSTSEDICPSPWFFEPHPSGCLEQYRIQAANTQTFQNGEIIRLEDTGQSFILFADGTWTNVGEDVVTAGQRNADRLGPATSDVVSFQYCGGHVNVSGVVTAYIKDINNRVLTWSIQSDGQKHLGWRRLNSVRINSC